MAEIKLVPRGKIGITVEAEVISSRPFCRKDKRADRGAFGLART